MPIFCKVFNPPCATKGTAPPITPPNAAPVAPPIALSPKPPSAVPTPYKPPYPAPIPAPLPMLFNKFGSETTFVTASAFFALSKPTAALAACCALAAPDATLAPVAPKPATVPVPPLNKPAANDGKTAPVNSDPNAIPGAFLLTSSISSLICFTALL